MQKDARINVLARAARTASVQVELADADKPTSILYLAAASYGCRPSSEDATVPTGFDPAAVALFEAIVEAAYVVATADGVFDADERAAFERVVAVACGGAVAAPQVAALVADLADQLAEDGIDRRIDAIAAAVGRKDHAREILRVAALLAFASEDISDVERAVLERLAVRCGLDSENVDTAIGDVKKAVGGAGF
jgi:tellurite resistance protein